MGGYTALAVAGATFDGASYDRWCRENRGARDCALFEGMERAARDPRRESAPYRDPRIKAAVALAPFGGPGIVEPNAKGVKVPVLIVATADDEVLRFSENASALAQRLPDAKLVAFPRGGHYAFVGPCTEKGRRFVPHLCQSPPGVDRDKLQERAADRTAMFLQETLSLVAE